MGYYVVKFLSDIVTLQEDKTTVGQIFNSGELVVTYSYLVNMKAMNDCYWQPENNQ